MKGSFDQSFHVLIVEDSLGDVALAKRAFSEMDARIQVHVAPRGEVALEMLRKQDGFADFPTPDLMLIDLNLPTIHGHELLKAIKSDPDLPHLNTVVFSSSARDIDIKKSYDLKANSYIVKPKTFSGYSKAVKEMRAYFTGLSSDVVNAVAV